MWAIKTGRWTERYAQGANPKIKEMGRPIRKALREGMMWASPPVLQNAQQGPVTGPPPAQNPPGQTPSFYAAPRDEYTLRNLTNLDFRVRGAQNLRTALGPRDIGNGLNWPPGS